METNLSTEEQIQKLLEENLAYQKEVYRLVKKIRTQLAISAGMTIAYIFILLLPIIAGAIYLPRLLNGGLGAIINPAGATNSAELLNTLKNTLQQYNLNQ